MNKPAKELARQATRFSFAGIANTAVTLVVYQGLLFLTSAHIAYALSWFLGLAMVLTLYPRHVFGRRAALPKAHRVSIAVAYAISFFIGLSIIYLCNIMGIWERLSIFISIGTTTVFNFLAIRYIVAMSTDGAE